MSFEITVSADRRMIVLRAHGMGTSAEGHGAFQQVQRHPDYRQGVPILVDVTALDYAPSPHEARLFAGLFASAFPCSMLAILCDAASHTAARELSILAVGRGANVAAFTRRDEACAWILHQPAPAPVFQPPIITDPRSRQPRARLSDGVVIPYALRDRIESAVLEVGGEGCSLRLDASAGWPSDEPDFAELTVSTEYAGAPRRARVDLRVSCLDDEDYVVSTVLDAMKAVLAGTPTASSTSASAVRR